MSADDERKAAVEEDDQGGDQTVGSTEEEKVEDEEPAQTTPTAPEKAFQLLVATLEKTGRIGIGKIVLREREHVVAIRAYGQGLLLQTLHFSDEVRSVDEIPTISGMKAGKFSPKEIELAEKLVASLTDEGMDFDIA